MRGVGVVGRNLELPSGKVEPGETLDQALIHEVREETGLDIAGIESHLGDFDYLSGSGKKSRQFNFAVTVADLEPVRLQEHDAYAWTTQAGEAPVIDAGKRVFAQHWGR